MLNAFDKLTANLKLKLYLCTALEYVMDFDLVTILDNGKRSLINIEVWDEAETTLRLHAVHYPLSYLWGESIEYIKCDLSENRHVNFVNLTEVYQRFLSAKEDIARDKALPDLIFGCLRFHDLNFKNLLIVNLSKYIVSACAEPLKFCDAFILVAGAYMFQWRP